VNPLLFLLAAAAQPAEPSVRAMKLPPGAVLRVDGRLDENVWSLASPASGLRQREPQEGAPGTEGTEVRVLYDESTLYVGVLARDREPKRVVARIRQRDTLLEPSGFEGSYEFAGDDAVAILLDPFRDRRNAVVFATNANGAEFDALITDESGAMNADWRTVWTVRAQRVSEGWSAEIAIPFRSLRYPSRPPDEGWGFNVWRVVRRKNEETLWTAWSRTGGGFNRVSQAGRLEGLAALPRPGLNLEMKPYGLAGFSQEAGTGDTLDTRRQTDLGLDAKWEVKPGLVLDATVHPDFAQVESDDEQVNLTRFELFFPEKRDFFLENAGIFDFGWRGFDETPPFLMFFSRRIGIAKDEESPIPLRGGLRLSGRAGRQTVGFLDVLTGEGAGQPAANYGVLRVKRDLGTSNYVGAMVADRRDEQSGNTAGGLDASFWPASTINLQGFYSRTWTSGPGGEGAAWRVGAEYDADRVGLEAQHLVVGPEADPQMGFVTRRDIRRTDVSARYTVRPAAFGLRKIDLFMEGQHIVRTTGEKQDVGAGPVMNMEWNSGDSIGAFYFQGSTRLDEAFDLDDRVTVPPGDYSVRHLSFSARSASSRPFVATATADVEDVYGGRIASVGGTVRAAPGSHLTLGLGFTRNRVDLPGGAFTADIGSLRATYAFSTRLFVSAFIQANRLDRRLLANFRLDFIHRPGSDLFVVFNEERGDGASLQHVARRGGAVKLTWLKRF
jgi:Domain of unknown function (DUF5916)